MKRFITLAAIALACIVSMAQSSNRFPAPLGLDRVLTGTVSRSKQTKAHSKWRYMLSTDGQTYQLHGHENELRKLVGKKVRVTGKTVGEDVTVNSVSPAVDERPE